MFEDLGRGVVDGAADALWVRGTDYVSAWQIARDAVVEFNGVLSEVGFTEVELMAFAGTGAAGEPVVRFRGSPVGARRAAWLLRLGAGTVSARRAGAW